MMNYSWNKIKRRVLHGEKINITCIMEKKGRELVVGGTERVFVRVCGPTSAAVVSRSWEELALCGGW